MSEQENKELVRRYFDERWNQQSYDVVDELLPESEAEDHKAWMRSVLGSFREIAFTIGDVIAEGDCVALSWRGEGVLEDSFSGHGSPGDHVSFEGLAMVRIEDGKIVEDLAYTEGFGSALLHQA